MLISKVNANNTETESEPGLAAEDQPFNDCSTAPEECNSIASFLSFSVQLLLLFEEMTEEIFTYKA